MRDNKITVESKKVATVQFTVRIAEGDAYYDDTRVTRITVKTPLDHAHKWLSLINGVVIGASRIGQEEMKPAPMPQAAVAVPEGTKDSW